MSELETMPVIIIDWAASGEVCGWCPCTLEQAYQRYLAGGGAHYDSDGCEAPASKSLTVSWGTTYQVCELHFDDIVAFIKALPGFAAAKRGES